MEISVVMPSYNTPEDILKEAVESILRQTFSDFEFIIVDDCSDNGTWDYIRSIRDKRVVPVRNPENLGVTKSLNVGLRMARGKYIARMDSDDIALPQRFEKQYAFMEKHPDAIACGAKVEFFGAHGGFSNQKIPDMETYRVSMLFSNPGPTHPTLFLNRALLQQNGIFYNEELRYAQDYGLYTEICRYGRVYLLEDVLLRHRFHHGQVSKQHRETQIQCDKITQRKLLSDLLGSVTDEELDLHYRYSTGYYKQETLSEEAIRWFQKLMAVNRRAHRYNQKKLEKGCNNIIKRMINQATAKNTPFLKAAALYFRYLAFPAAVKASAGKGFRSILHLKK